MTARHRHTPYCYDVQVTCGQAQHTHLRTCYASDDPGDRDARSRLTCSRTEHEHVGSCSTNVLICGNT